MRRPAPVRAAGGVLAVSPAAALAATPPLTGSFAFEDQLPVQPGHPASCSFPVAVHRQVRGTHPLFLDTQGQPARLLLNEHWTGTGAANGTYVAGHAAQKRHRGSRHRRLATAGQVHDRVPFGGGVIHGSGLLRFDANGNLTFEAGPHQGFNGDPTAIQEFCAALS
jgi:hypothetical protein